MARSIGGGRRGPLHRPRRRPPAERRDRIALAPSDGDHPATLMRYAAIAQHAGRTSTEHMARFELALSQEAEGRLLIEQQLPLALERGELSVAYQPEVDAVSHASLVSRRSPAGITRCSGRFPIRFIPIAEEIGGHHGDRSVRPAERGPACGSVAVGRAGRPSGCGQRLGLPAD